MQKYYQNEPRVNDVYSHKGLAYLINLAEYESVGAIK